MAVLTIKHYVDLANSFITNVKNPNNSYYVYVGRPQPWANSTGGNDDSATSVSYNSSVDTVYDSEQTVYDNILYGKLVTNNNIHVVIPRYNWVNNTPYARYDANNPDLFDPTTNTQFYVVNDSYQVFKVINNNNGGNSTVKPALTTTSGTFTTSDGYVWKYMYTIDSASNTYFTSPYYIPVTTNTMVSGNATPGSIDSAIITNGGIGYNIYEDGYLQNFIDAYNVQLPQSSSATDNYYVNSSIYLKSGYGSGQLRKIISYNGLTRTLEIDTGNPFEFYSHLVFTGQPQGTVAIGYQVSQPIDFVFYEFLQGYFNRNDTVIQSDTGATGYVLAGNTSVFEITRSTPTEFNYYTYPSNYSNVSLQNVSIWYPIIDVNNYGILQTNNSGGNTYVSIQDGGIYANVVGSSFVANTTYAVNQYIRVGNNSSVSTNVRRIIAVNTSVITVDIPFVGSNTSSTHYLMPNVFEPSTVGVTNIYGTVSDINLNSVTMAISNLSITGTTFIVGESVNMVNASNTYQGANGIVAYSNTTSVTLSAVNGNWTTNLFIQGQSSQLTANIGIVTNTPNITVANPTSVDGGTFISGQPVYFQFNGANTGNATLASSATIPNSLTEYTIGPTITITGDGENAEAYAIVNTQLGSSNSVSQIVFINPGKNYTYANISIYSNSNFGSGASAIPVISPINGHGYDAVTELGGRFCAITTTFDTLANENFHYPYYGQFRTVGLLENPKFNDVTVNLNSFDRVKLAINNRVNSFIPGEIIINTANATSNLYSNASGICVYSNTSYLELMNVRGTWTNAANSLNLAYGISSNAYANISSANVAYFSDVGDTVYQNNSNATGLFYGLAGNSNSTLNLTNVTGRLSVGNTIYDPVVNAYANVVSIFTANDTLDVSSTFGTYFNQMARITLTSNTIPFTQFEYVQQSTTNANGLIVSTTSDLDLLLTSVSGSFSVGQTITNQFNGNTATILYANNITNYLKLTNVSNTQAFFVGNTINNGVGSTATISMIYPVLILNDVNGENPFLAQSSNGITGSISGAVGYCSNGLNITYPSLVRESGKVLYIENFAPVTKTANSQEQVKIVIKF
jgi:hypothetical protein